MKSTIKFLAILSMFFSTVAYSQSKVYGDMQDFRKNDYDGLNVFEAPKDSTPFDGLKVRVGGDFALQFQAINNTNDAGQPGVDTLYDLASNFNLPTANLNIDVQLYDGMRMHLRTYLSSRHHTESYVKGGYLRIDKLDFIKKDFLKGFMDITYIKIGMDEFDYGDTHFRRSDNARAIYNPFVGNYIMDSFSTEAFGEICIKPKNGLIVLLGLTNGKLNQNVTPNNRYNFDNKVTFYGKLGYDKQFNEDLRFRITGSWYMNNGVSTGNYLYGGDRAGARYYSVMEANGAADNFTSGRFNPGFKQQTSIQINPFLKWKGLEFFGVYELAMEGDEGDYSFESVGVSGTTDGGSYTQLGAELIYRFGGWDQFYAGLRYNSVSGKDSNLDTALEKEISRFNVGAGWFMTKNVLAKLEYVTQSYSGDGWEGSIYQGGNFNGVVFEAVISF